MQHKLGFGKVLAEHDKAMKDYFGDMVIYDKNGESKKVPIFYGNEDRFELMNDGSVLSQKIPLPHVFIYRKDLYRGASRWRVEYQLTFRTFLQSDMDQLLEQLMMRFVPHAEVETANLGELELEINKMPHVEDKHLKLHRYDWLISTEVKR